MDTISSLRKEAKKYIDKADDKTLEIVYRILEISNEANDPLANMSVEQEESLRRSLKQADRKQTISHETVMKKYSKWFKQ